MTVLKPELLTTVLGEFPEDLAIWRFIIDVSSATYHAKNKRLSGLESLLMDY